MLGIYNCIAQYLLLMSVASCDFLLKSYLLSLLLKRLVGKGYANRESVKLQKLGNRGEGIAYRPPKMVGIDADDDWLWVAPLLRRT
jgi:hypothetical protein